MQYLEKSNEGRQLKNCSKLLNPLPGFIDDEREGTDKRKGRYPTGGGEGVRHRTAYKLDTLEVISV